MARHYDGMGIGVSDESESAMNRVISRDGTAIAFDRLGKGEPIILVDGALCGRSFGPMPKLAPLLASHFSVFMYDRRGRGSSGDTKPYAKEHELEDIDIDSSLAMLVAGSIRCGVSGHAV